MFQHTHTNTHSQKRKTWGLHGEDMITWNNIKETENIFDY